MLVGMVQVCLNGSRDAAGSGVVPMVPEELADAAGKAVAVGARDTHVHPRSPCGRESLTPGVLTPVLEAVRAVVDVPVGVTHHRRVGRAGPGAPGGLGRVFWISLDQPAASGAVPRKAEHCPRTGCPWVMRQRREVPCQAPRAQADPKDTAQVRAWPVLPDHASVNWHEPGAEAVAAALLERGVGVEAGIWSGTDGAERFAVSPLGPRVLRVLAEVMDPSASARETARGLLRALDAYGAHGRPVLLHGEDGGAWPVLRLAGELGLATRIGVEDTLLLPDGSPAASNAELVRAALRELARAPSECGTAGASGDGVRAGRTGQAGAGRDAGAGGPLPCGNDAGPGGRGALPRGR